ncbi:MAG: hypothetical protein V1907_01815 [Candidatus Kerfeldbacteria bacterium]
MLTKAPLTARKKLTQVRRIGSFIVALIVVAVLFTGSHPSNAQVAPTITLVTSNYGTTTATFQWTTDVAAMTSIQWRLSSTAVWGPLEEAEGSYQTDHQYTISNLTPNTSYVMRIYAVTQDDPPFTAYGQEFGFTTTTVNITNIKIDLNTKKLSWTTNAAGANAIHIGRRSGWLNCGFNDANQAAGDHGVDIPNACAYGTDEDAPGHPAVPPTLGLGNSYRYFFEIVVYPDTGGSYGTGQHYFYTGPITITAGPSTPQVFDHGAQFIWTTNIEGSHTIQYGTQPGNYTTTYDSIVTPSMNHSVTIPGGLASGTIYYYRVISKTRADITSVPVSYDAISGEFSFTTSGIAPGTPLLFNSGPDALATSNEATISFTTNIPTTALVEFNVNPGLSPDAKSSGYTQMCNDPQVCVAPGVPKWVSTVAGTSYSITITGLTTPNRDYYYRVTVRDASGRLLGTGVLKFKTTLSPFDHKFSTGNCSDGTEIGKCNAEGMYCRPGGIGPVYDCRPSNKDCPYECPQGSTCVDTGDCINDPSPGDSLTSCNPKSCYMKCNSVSGDMAGKRCSFDTDCNGGKCIVSSFVTPAGPGCYKSWSSCDANVVLKVRPDRVCNKWYTCKTAFQTVGSGGKAQSQCMDLTICDSLSPNGQCNDVLEGRQCSNDPLRFCKDDTDCIGATATCLPEGTHKTMTYKTPEEVSNIKGFTGYAFAGLDWHSAYMWDKNVIVPTPAKIEGRFPLSVADQIGTKATVTNGDFEDYGISLKCAKKQTVPCTLNALPISDEPGSCIANDVDYGPCVVIRDLQALIAKYWKTVDLKGSSSKPLFTIDTEGSKATLNQVLKITPTDLAGTGAMTTNLMGIQTSANVEYLISVRMRSKNDGQLVQASFVNSTGDEKYFPMETLGTAWQTYLMGPVEGLGGNDTSIAFKTVNQSNEAIPFWIDDLKILPALLVSDVEKIPESCRLFPNSSSPKCDYVDSASISYRGMKGYCLERDPLNTAVCLTWWPVDIIAGDNIFGQDASAGYNDRQPLYACMESVGQWNKPDPLTGDTTFVAGERTRAMQCEPESAYVPKSPLCDQPFQNYRMMATEADLWVDKGDQHAENCAETVENVPACRDGNQRGFCACYGGGSGGWFDTSALLDSTSDRNPDQDIHEYEVEYFRVTKLRFTSLFSGVPELILNKANGWRAFWGMDPNGTRTSELGNQGGTGLCHGLEIILEWDANDKHLKRVKFYLQSCMAYGNDDNDDHGIFAIGLFFMKEQCTKLVQVATDTGTAAWTDRTSKSGTYVIPGLNYRYISDMPPVGTVAPPSALLPPDQWTNGVDPAALLSVESPDTTKTYPYQIRAGMTYACAGNCSGRMCTNAQGAKMGAGCFTSDDCTDSSLTPPVFGKCVGSGTCAVYDPDLNRYTYQTTDPDNLLPDRKAPQPCTYDYSGGKRCNANSGKRAGTTCRADSDCQYSIGRCINPGASGYCDANSGQKAGFLCGSDDICKQTYDGKCVNAGKACTAASGAKANAPCSSNNDCSSSAGVCTTKHCDAASGPALYDSISGVGAACTQPSDCTKSYIGQCVGGTCDAASGPNAGKACDVDPSVCQVTAVGACQDTGVNHCDMYSTVPGKTPCAQNTDCAKVVQGQCIDAPMGCPVGELCCDYRDEVCVGGFASSKGAQSVDTSGNPPSLTCVTTEALFNGKPCRTKADCGLQVNRACTGNREYFGEYQIMRLFAQAYSYWVWDARYSKYTRADYVCTNAGSFSGLACDPTNTPPNFACNSRGSCSKQEFWNPPTRVCKACNGGTYVNYACTVQTPAKSFDDSCPGATNARCVATQNHPSQNARALTADANADYCAVKPKFISIESANKSALIDEGSIFILKFNVSVNDEQLPLTQVDIDWGDGNMTSDGPLRIAPREDPKFPHAYTHTYHCSGKGGVCDPYYIKVRVKDGWGWCSNGTDKYLTTPACSDGQCRCGDESQACCGVANGRCDRGTPGKCSSGLRADLACTSDSDCLAWENGPIIQVIH